MPQNPFANTFETALEQGQTAVTQTVTNQAQQVASAVSTQTVGSDITQSPNPDGKAGLQDQFNETGTNVQQQQQAQDPQKSPQELAQMEIKSQEEQQKKLEEARQKLQLHQKLHKQTYFDPTFNNRPKEPTVQERLQQEEQEEEQKKMLELQEEKKKEAPVALRQAQTRAEIQRGASG